MAERLRPTEADGLGNISQASVQAFIQEFRAAEADAEKTKEHAKAMVKDAKDAVKGVRARIKDAGIRLDAFDRAYADAERVAEDRDEEERHYRYLMAMLGKNEEVAEVAEVPTPDAPYAGMDDPYIDKVEIDGYQAGKAGYDASTNPHPVGSEGHAVWLNAWTRGQGDKVVEEILPPQDTARRGRGRPRKGPLNGAEIDRLNRGEDPNAPDQQLCPHHPWSTSGKTDGSRWCEHEGCEWRVPAAS